MAVVLAVVDVTYAVEQNAVVCGEQRIALPAAAVPRFVKHTATDQRARYALWLDEQDVATLEGLLRHLEQQAPGHGNLAWLEQVNTLSRLVRWARMAPERQTQAQERAQARAEARARQQDAEAAELAW